MKKFRNIFGSVFLLFSILILTGCGNKNAINVEDFKSKLKNKNYNVIDISNQYENYDYIKSVIIAKDKSDNYQIEFYVFDSEENANNFYSTNRENFEKSKSAAAIETSVSIGNHSKYTLTYNDKYGIVSKIDNTAIYLNVDLEYQETVKEILSELGY